MGGDRATREGAEAPGSSRRATAAGLLAVLLWCWSGPALAAGTRALGTMSFLALACAIGVLTGLVREAARGGSPARLLAPPPRVAAAGLLGVALYTLLLATAMGLAEERELGQVVLANYLWPVWIVLFGALLLEDRPRLGPMLLATALGLAGVAVSRGGETFARPPTSLVPHGLALAGSLLWALYSVLLRRWRVPVERSGATLPFVVCAVVAAALAIIEGEALLPPTLTPSAVIWLLVYGVGAVGLGYPLWEVGMKRGASQVLAVAAYFIPVVSAGLMALLFHETAGPGLLAGAALITAGAVVAGRAGLARRTRAT
jgi:drug/metabolite transporter (DMT)-like permease